MTEAQPTPYERGVEAGRIDEVLRHHAAHLTTINGSIADTARHLGNLTDEVRKVREEARLRDERVIAAASALADETERRRAQLADTTTTSDRHFTRRERIAAGALTLVGAIAGAIELFGGGL